MHLEILDDKRRALLPLFSALKSRYYLAGGTALALQIGHRDSIDFDFFSPTSFDTSILFTECEQIFTGYTLTKTQDERDTLSFLIDNTVSVSFLGYPYPLVESLVEAKEFNLASLTDIGCMKFGALSSRSVLKDYVDIFFILKSLSLRSLLDAAANKLPTLDRNLILKSLVYFDDVTKEQIRFMPGFEISFAEIQLFLQKTVAAEVKSV